MVVANSRELWVWLFLILYDIAIAVTIRYPAAVCFVIEDNLNFKG
jgi:hypothetical protein